MSNDTYVWIGGPQGFITDAGNWYDETTHSVAATPPSATTTLVFRPGTYSVSTEPTGEQGFDGGKLILLGGAHLTFSGTAIPPPTFNFTNITEQANASLTVTNAALWDNSVVLRSGATLDVSHTQFDGHALGIFGTELGAVTNTGGTEIYGVSAAVGNVPQPQLNVGHPGPGFLQTGGFTSSESVTPGATTLKINLGSFAQGSTPAAITLAADNPNNAAGFSALTIAAAGNGYTTDLFPSIAAAQAAVNAPSVGGYVAIGTIDVNTATLGTHQELISLKSGGTTTETLLITDKIV